MFDHEDRSDHDPRLAALFAEARDLDPSQDFDRRIARHMTRARLIHRGVTFLCLTATAGAITAILAPMLGAMTPHAMIPTALAVLGAGLAASLALGET